MGNGDIVGISKEPFRQWTRIVPVIGNGRGHVPNFSFGGGLTSAVLRRLTDKSLIINLQKRSCVLVNDPSLPLGELFDVCAPAPLIETLEYSTVPTGGRVRKAGIQ